MNLRLANPPFRPGSVVLITLRDPREKFWGALRELGTAGVSVYGIDLNSFDDFAAQVRAGDLVGPSEVFFPMHRVERIDMDAPYGILPSFSEQVEHRTGRSAAEILGLPPQSRERASEIPDGSVEK